MIFDSIQVLGRTLLTGVLAYIFTVLILRLTGKRTLTKWNAFDFIVTIALGSTLATVILSRDVSLAQGAVALALLCLLQLIVTWFSVRSERFQHLVKSTPGSRQPGPWFSLAQIPLRFAVKKLDIALNGFRNSWKYS